MDPTLLTHPVDMEGKSAANMKKFVLCFLVITYYNLSCVHSQVASVFYYNNGDSNPFKCSG